MLLFLDWDETVSAVDTLSLIAPSEGQQLHGPPFASYTQAYISDLEAHSKTHPPGKTIDEQLEHLASLDEVELKSQSRIEEGGLFRDLEGQTIIARAQDVELRAGWEAAFAPWLRTNLEAVETHIISVGWSAAFIRARLSSLLPPNIPLSICANEVEVSPETGLCTGRLTKSADASDLGKSGIRTGLDKRREMRRIIKTASAERGEKRPIVYVGDSNTDLPCLLEADVGIAIGGNESLRKTCERLGIRLVDSVPSTSGKGQWLVQAADWFEVLKILQPLAPAAAAASGTSS